MSLREQFEKIEKIEKILNRNKHFISFSEKLGLYVCDLQAFKDDVMWINGAWFMFRELNKSRVSVSHENEAHRLNSLG